MNNMAPSLCLECLSLVTKECEHICRPSFLKNKFQNISIIKIGVINMSCFGKLWLRTWAVQTSRNIVK